MIVPSRKTNNINWLIEYCLTPASSISAIFMTRTSSTIYKHYMYIEMREELDYPDDDFWLLLERMEIWRRWKISPRWLLHALLFFQNLQMRSLTHGAWHSPITLPTMVDGQTFHIIIWQSQDGEVFNTWGMALSHHFTHNGRRSGFPYYNLTAPGRSVKYDKWHHCDLDFDFKVKSYFFILWM